MTGPGGGGGRWDGSVVWITGASSGIGAALARALAERGAQLVLSARNPERLAAVRAACARPEAHLVVPLDLADPETLGPAAERALAHRGRIDVLILNAAVSQRALARDTLPAVDRRILETNFLGPVVLTKAVLPAMLARRVGHLVVVSSLAAKVPVAGSSSYVASKHALHGFFDTLRAEVWRDGLRVTLVCPGAVRTAISLHALRGDGSRHGVMDPAQDSGMAPEICALAILDAVERGKDEVLIAGRARWLVHLKRLFPGLYHRGTRAAVARRERGTSAAVAQRERGT